MLLVKLVMIEKALEKLQNMTKNQPVGFELLPKKFTMPQLQYLYESIFETKYDRRNFSKKMFSLGLLIRLEEKDMSTSKKGAFLYKFDQKKYLELARKGYNLEFL